MSLVLYLRISFFFKLLHFLLNICMVFDNTESKHKVQSFTKLFIEIIKIHVLLEIVPWDFIGEVSCDPWMLKCFFNGVS